MLRECPFCAKLYGKPRRLETHMKRHHKDHPDLLRELERSVYLFRQCALCRNTFKADIYTRHRCIGIKCTKTIN